MSDFKKSPLHQALKMEGMTTDDAPVVLLPYQQRWINLRCQLKVGEKSRRIGLTWAEASDNVLTAGASRNAGGQNVYYIGYNQDMTIEYIQACAMWARAFDYAAGEIEEGIWEDGEVDKAIKTYTINFPSGFRVTALTSRPSNLRGRQGVVVLDEAAFHEDLAELLKAALALLIWGGEVHVISTHDGTDNPFNVLINEIRAEKRKGEVFRCTFREAVADGLYRRVCLRKGTPWSQEDEDTWVAGVYAFYGDGAAEELDCVPSQGGGAWLSLALLEKRTSRDVPVLRLKRPDGWISAGEHLRLADTKAWCEQHLLPLLTALPKGARCFFGMDFARKQDLSVITPLVQQQDLRRRPPFLVELRNVPYAEQRLVLFYVVDRFPLFLGGAIDAGGNGGEIAEAASVRYGSIRIAEVMLSEGWYRDNMPPVKAALEDGTLYDLPADQDVVDDWRLVQLVKGVARVPDSRSTDKDGKKRHGDAAISGALAWFASRNAVAPYEFIEVPKTNGRWTEDTSRSGRDSDFGDSWKGGSW
ncbi:hypothetical protein [Aeromonas veronii]|uniref:hypothetical protein n=1 Tax=Aeromonas veronii TaxID=654 RepID=UPI003F40A640